MSPERISGENYNFPSDIWSLGMIAYEAASGGFPFDESICKNLTLFEWSVYQFDNISISMTLLNQLSIEHIQRVNMQV